MTPTQRGPVATVRLVSTRRTATAAGPFTARRTGVPGALVSRRSLGYGSVATLVVLTGCGDPGSATSATPSSATPSATPTTRTDEELLAAALHAEQSLADQLATSRQAQTAGPVGDRLLGASQLHQAHVRLLGEAGDGASPGSNAVTPSPSPTTAIPPGAALAALARAERQLVGQHTAAAVAARSGTFARVLAGMAAAAAQQAVLLERLAARPAPSAGAS
jgi:hypothetical protein